jgi:lysophospholipid acyltransferase (LPLAT)-like uncharacterized protein
MRIRSRLFSKLAAGLGVGLIRLLFWTCRVDIHTDVPGINPYVSTGSKRFLYCVWHDQLIMSIFSGRLQQVAGLVSRHQDGSYLADAMEMVGITPVRGSTNRGGGRAMRGLIRLTRHLHVVITPDGPRGPRREIKPGLVFLASHSGRAIVPTAFWCKRCLKIRGSWTDMVIPQPFTKVFVRGGEPIHVPAQLKRAELDFYQAKLLSAMDRLEAEAELLAAGEELPPADSKAAA